jgi:uridine kinase
MFTRRSISSVQDRIVQAILSKPLNRPSVTVICGANATGKTTLAKNVVRKLGKGSCVMIELDDYQYSRQKKIEWGITGQNPKGTRLDQARRDILELIAERSILKPRYEFKSGNILSKEVIHPNKYIIINGTSAFADEIRTLADLSIFLETSDEELMKRRLKRDTKVRGYSKGRVRELFPELERDYRKFIEPMKREAYNLLGH